MDNVPPSVSLTPLNDANPGGWAVNHSVTLRVTPTAGPSGVSSVSCVDTVNGTPRQLSGIADGSVGGAYDVTVDGNGAHHVSCTVANNAVDPSGAHNTGTSNVTVDIDEQPPTLSFEATNPAAPNQVVVDTSDSESPVESGGIAIAPAGSTNFMPLATDFASNGQLIATLPDAHLRRGSYTLRATATSFVGNTGSVTESITLPLRAPTTGATSFAKIVEHLVAKKVRERVRVGWHWGARLNKKGRPVKVKVGGHFRTITVIKRVARCGTRRVKLAKHRWKLETRCSKPHVRYLRKLTIGFGKRTTVYGELTSSQGIPIAHQWVTVRTAPSNGSRRFRVIGHAMTNAEGGWKLTLPAGPSRVVQASYAGSATLLPDSSSVHLAVPARIKITVSPRTVSWHGIVTIRGRLVGGYVPADGVAMRLLIKLPGRGKPYSPVPFRTAPNGSFAVRWSWGTGSGVATYPFSVATTSNESDYPYAASGSRWVRVTFGG